MGIIDSPEPIRARSAALVEIREKVVPLYVSPTPCCATLRAWFRRARVQTFKANRVAKRGGGTVYYSLADAEKVLRGMMAK